MEADSVEKVCSIEDCGDNAPGFTSICVRYYDISVINGHSVNPNWNSEKRFKTVHGANVCSGFRLSISQKIARLSKDAIDLGTTYK